MGWIVGVVKLVPMIVGAVHAVEAIAGKDKHGKEKQDAAVTAFNEMLKAADIPNVDTAITKAVEFEALLRRFIDDYVAIQNLIAKSKP